MELNRTGVIYAIRYFEKILYIGQTVNPDKRINSHKRKLLRGTHSLNSLQEYFNKVEDKDEITFELLEDEIPVEYLSIRERHYFDTLKPIFFGAEPSSLIIYVDRKSPSGSRSCRVCLESFEISSSKQIYCSYECYYSGRKRSHVCKNCLKSFETFSTKSDYCSLKCLYSSNQYNLTCISCKKGFESSKKDSKYCPDSECLKRRSFYNLNCAICLNSFKAKNKKARFCSSECRKAGRQSFKLTCNVCGSPFKSSKEWAKYCSSNCRNYFSNLKKD